MQFTNALNKFIDKLESLHRSPSTIIAYKKDLEQLFDHLSKEESVNTIDEITPTHLSDYINGLIEKKLFSLKTISRKINSMKTLFRFLLEKGDLDRNPSTQITHPKYEASKPRVLTVLEFRALRDVARVNIRLYAIVELLLQTGIRIGELARLKLEDVTLNGKQKKILITAHASNPSRTIKINDAVTLALSMYLQLRAKPESQTEYFFITKTGRPLLIRNIRTSINKAFTKAGVPKATVNDIRNTFIVYQLKNNVKIEALAKYVGHKRLTSTKKFIEFLDTKYKPKTNQIKTI